MNHGYTLTVSRDFIAQHYLIGGDWGAENEPHSHHYRIDLILSGPDLDRNGYLVDIVAVEARIEKFVDRFRDAMLNDLPEFVGLNPSIEHFARIAWESLTPALLPSSVREAAVRMHENEIASVTYSAPLTE